MNFLKKNKFKIIFVVLCIIFAYSKYSKVLGVNNKKDQDIEKNKLKGEVIVLDIGNQEFAEDGSLTEDEQAFLNLINANRENYGITKLDIDTEIQNIARLKANDLVNNNYFSHISPVYGNVEAMFEDFDIEYKLVGENIAGNNNLVGAVEAWMNSENHKGNILNDEYNYTGVAVIESENYGKVFVQIFAKK